MEGATRQLRDWVAPRWSAVRGQLTLGFTPALALDARARACSRCSTRLVALVRRVRWRRRLVSHGARIGREARAPGGAATLIDRKPDRLARFRLGLERHRVRGSCAAACRERSRPRGPRRSRDGASRRRAVADDESTMPATSARSPTNAPPPASVERGRGRRRSPPHASSATDLPAGARVRGDRDRQPGGLGNSRGTLLALLARRSRDPRTASYFAVAEELHLSNLVDGASRPAGAPADAFPRPDVDTRPRRSGGSSRLVELDAHVEADLSSRSPVPDALPLTSSVGRARRDCCRARGPGRSRKASTRTVLAALDHAQTSA